MSWPCLSLRKQELKGDYSRYTYEDLQKSRDLRRVHKKLSADQSAFNNSKKAELREAKEKYTEVRSKRPSIPKQSDYENDTEGYNNAKAEYEEWQQEYNDAKEEYEAAKADIEDYYDDLNEDLETEAQDEEDMIQDEITKLETQRDATNAELQAITDQIKSDIEANTIRF